tara:strand:+ start:137422 stop:137535 length:114 start_codon:yes stop_codon:yes gene_type:complete
MKTASRFGLAILGTHAVGDFFAGITPDGMEAFQHGSG